MDLRRIATVSIGLLFLLLAEGCNRPPAQINQALASTNAAFYPTPMALPTMSHPPLSTPIVLSAGQLGRFKEIVHRFNNPRQVRVMKGLELSPTASFLLGNIRFSWAQDLLVFHDSERNLSFVVQDPALGKMSDRFREQLAETRAELSTEDWQKVLAALHRAQ
jgi:hypothetical protein